MPDGMISKEDFERIEDQNIKLNYLYSLSYELYKKRRWGDIKAVGGGFLGGFTAVTAKFLFWK